MRRFLQQVFFRRNYLVNLLEAIDYTQYITGAAQPKLTKQKLENILIPNPPLSEQNKISEFLLNSNYRINIVLDNAKQQIKNLKEYRQSLIFEAVTGKIDVRDWADKPFERSDAVANA
jgi:type I restriction enzyme S subunit